jgi:hypothetical protein
MGTSTCVNNITVDFEHKGKKYSGFLSPVNGAGQPMWQLLIDGYFFGNLRYREGWVFDSKKMPEIAGLLGDYVTTCKDDQAFKL